MNKPKIEDVIDILSMKYEVARLYNEIDRRVTHIKETFGPGRYDYDLETLVNGWTSLEVVIEMKQKGRYFKFEIEDNIKKMQEGETIFSTSAVKPISFFSRSLKKQPDSLD